MKKTTIAMFLSLLMLPFLSGCGEAKASEAGTYELNKEAFIEALAANVPEAGREAAKKQMSDSMKDMTGTLVLSADNKCSLKITGENGENASGTYKLEGEKITFTMKGEKDKKEESKSGTLKDGAITLEETKMGMTMKMVFNKK